MNGFSVIYRNPGHWDIVRSGEGRLFCICGDIGCVFVYDERKNGNRGPQVDFKTVSAAFAYISDILMFEPLASNGDNMIDSASNKLVAVMSNP